MVAKFCCRSHGQPVGGVRSAAMISISRAISREGARAGALAAVMTGFRSKARTLSELCHGEEPTGPARSGRPDDKLRDEAAGAGLPIYAWATILVPWRHAGVATVISELAMPLSAYIQSVLFVVAAAAALFVSAGTVAIAGFWIYLAILAAVIAASLAFL